MNIGEEEYTKVVEDGILTMKERLLVDIGADLQNAYNEGYKQGKKDASGNIIRCKDCRFWKRTTDSLQGICYLLRINPTGMWYCANARPINDGYQNTWYQQRFEKIN